MTDANKFHRDSRETVAVERTKVCVSKSKAMHLSIYLKEGGVKLEVSVSCLSNFPNRVLP